NGNPEIREKLNSDEEFMGLVNKAGFENLRRLLRADVRKNLPEEDEYELKILEEEEDINKFLTYANEEITTFEPEVKISQIIDESINVSEIIDEQTDNINNTKENVGKIEKLKDEEMNTILMEEILKPVETRAENIGEEYSNRLKTEKNMVENYGNNISAYVPIDSSSEIEDKLNTLSDNTMDLSTNLHDNNDKYLSLVDKVFEGADKNTSIMLESIDDAMECSEKKIHAGLKDAKNIKDDTSKENQEHLDSISKKLDYTRVGSIEYTQVYDFIVNPVNIENNNDIVKNGIDIDINKKEEQDNFQVTESENNLNLISNYKVLILVCVSLIFLLIIFVLLNRKET